MSLALLLEKYDVSTEEGLQKALSEIEKEESEVDEALAAVMSRTSLLEGKLRTASQAYTKLATVKADAQEAAEMVDKTAALAQDVSAKVRQLDLARSRVAECQSRVHDLIDLQLCSVGVESAMKAHDYETAAAHVARFLSMSEGAVRSARARGTADPRADINRAADNLYKQLRAKFEEASRKQADAEVERLSLLFPQIGRAADGMELLAQYLAKQVANQIRIQCKVTDMSPEAMGFAEASTKLVEIGITVLRRIAALSKGSVPLHKALVHIQPTISSGCRRLYTELVTSRELRKTPPGGALRVELALTELAATHRPLLLYHAALIRLAQQDAQSLSEEGRKAAVEAVEKILAESELMRTAQDILSDYLSLERYFLEENVQKALKMSSQNSGGSSLVDDVFFIARKVIRRSVSCGSVEGVCAIVNECATMLERDVAPALRAALRHTPNEVLPFTSPCGQSLGLDLLANALNKDLNAQRETYLSHVAEAETGAAWAGRLAADACAHAEPLLTSPRDREKVQSCASGLASAAAAFTMAHEMALSGIRADLKPKIYAWADALVAPDGDLDDEEDADALPAALEALLNETRVRVSETTADALMAAILTELTARAEKSMLRNRYTQVCGACVERRVRRAAAWAGGAGARGGRERAARLLHAAALLTAETGPHARDALVHGTLTPQRARDVLATRVDFKMEDIKRLKL